MFKLVAPAAALLLLLIVASWGPVSLGYVSSDSMTPTLAPDDGFLLVTVSDPDVGDIVTYFDPRSETLVTHRVVGRADDGFLTRGDANPTTDQAAGAPVVTREAVVGVVVEHNGQALVVPSLGVIARALSGNLPLVIALLVVVAVAREVLASRAVAARAVVRSGDVVWPMLATAFVVTTVIVATAPISYGIDAVVTTSGVGASLPTDSEVVEPLDVAVLQSPVTTLLVETKSGRIADSETRVVAASTLDRFSTARSTRALPLPLVDAAVPVATDREYVLPVSVVTPTDPGFVAVELAVFPYPATLPEPVLLWLHGVHPAVAAAVSVGVGLLPLALLYRLAFDSRVPLRLTPRWRPGTANRGSR
jgi:signal peptidase